MDVRKFIDAYIEAAEWTGILNDDDSDEMFPDVRGEVEWSDEAMAEVRTECLDFIWHNREDLRQALNMIFGYNESNAGHDFFLTRNGHGAGFWDRGLGPVGDRLSAASKPYGATNYWLDADGVVRA